MRGKLASRRTEEFRQIQDSHLRKEFQARLNGTEKFNTFDLEDISKLDLTALSGDTLEDVKKVVLYADEKRRVMEDYRAWRRNSNDWLVFFVSVGIGVGLPFFLPEILVWILNACTLAPQSVLLAIKTARKY